jgi:hypothetical protein
MHGAETNLAVGAEKREVFVRLGLDGEVPLLAQNGSAARGE